MPPYIVPYDVLQRICEKVSLKRDLVHLSLVCKRFQDAALDKLWLKIPSMVPLIMVMPTDLWTISSYESPMSVWEESEWDSYTPEEQESRRDERMISALTFNRLLVKSDWTRLDYYGSRVRELIVRPFRLPTSSITSDMLYIDDTIWKSFACYIPSRKLLQQVHTVTLNFSEDPNAIDSLPFLHALLHPGISTIHFISPSADNATMMHYLDEAMLVSALSIHCPGLESLTYEEASWDDYTAFSNCLMTLPHLKHLDTTAIISTDAFEYLSGLENLRHLAISIYDEQLEHLPGSLSPSTFSGLQSLRLRVKSWDHASALLDKLHTRLTEIAVINSDWEYPPLWHIEPVTSRIATMSDSLSRLSLTIPRLRSEGGEIPDWERNSDPLGPLRALGHLDHFQLTAPEQNLFTRSLFANKPCFWRRIRIIEIFDHPGSIDHVPPKLVDVASWFADYTTLEELTISMVVEPISSSETALRCSIWSLSEKGICFPTALPTGIDKTTFYHHIATSLSRCFPNLRLFSGVRFGTTQDERFQSVFGAHDNVKKVNFWLGW